MATEYEDIDWLPLRAVPKYLKQAFNLEYTRETVYNWVRCGIHRQLGRFVHLKTERRGKKRYTRRSWVREFLEETDAGRFSQ